MKISSSALDEIAMVLSSSNNKILVINVSQYHTQHLFICDEIVTKTLDETNIVTPEVSSIDRFFFTVLLQPSLCGSVGR